MVAGDATRIALLRIYGFTNLRTRGVGAPVTASMQRVSAELPVGGMVLQSGQVRVHDRCGPETQNFVAACNLALSSASTDLRIYGLAEFRHHAE